MGNVLTRLCISTFSILEYILSRMQGKGQGSFSIRAEIATASKFIVKNPVSLIDVGGNKGLYSAELRKRFPNSEIHIFEPSLSNADILKAKFANDTKVKINNFGLGKKDYTTTLFADEDGSGMGSVYQRKLDHFGISFDHKEIVTISTMFKYWEEVLARGEVDFVKVDIEGLELDALQGFQEAILACKVIQFEFGGCNIDSRTYFQDFWYFFIQHNFKVYRITPFGPYEVKKYTESLEHFSTTNYLAINQQR